MRKFNLERLSKLQKVGVEHEQFYVHTCVTLVISERNYSPPCQLSHTYRYAIHISLRYHTHIASLSTHASYIYYGNLPKQISKNKPDFPSLTHTKKRFQRPRHECSRSLVICFVQSSRFQKEKRFAKQRQTRVGMEPKVNILFRKTF